MQQIRQARRTAERNPLGLAVGAAGVGFALGLLLPGTRVENEKLGAAGDKVGEVAREGWEHGKQVAQDTAQGAMEAAKDSSSRHSEELSSSLQERLPAGQEQTAAAEAAEAAAKGLVERGTCRRPAAPPTRAARPSDQPASASGFVIACTRSRLAAGQSFSTS